MCGCIKTDIILANLQKLYLIRQQRLNGISHFTKAVLSIVILSAPVIMNRITERRFSYKKKCTEKKKRKKSTFYKVNNTKCNGEGGMTLLLRDVRGRA